MTARYHLLHKTTYDFAESVPWCELEAQLRPRPQAGLSCLSHLVSVIPLPQDRSMTVNRFGNPVEQMTVRGRLRRLIVSATTTVELGPEWSASAAGDDPPPLSLGAAENALASDDETRRACFDYAAPALGGSASRLDGITELALQINRDMTYDARITDIGRPVATLLRDRRGMCQDYTRLAVAALRAHGIGARWVVGYVLPGTRRNPAPHGSYRWLHAWFSAFVPECGWVDFDATEPTADASALLTLARGADELEVGPLRGKLAIDVSRQRVGVDIEIDRVG
jgi:transglutaminase-like putative cysteine protease